MQYLVFCPSGLADVGKKVFYSKVIFKSLQAFFFQIHFWWSVSFPWVYCYSNLKKNIYWNTTKKKPPKEKPPLWLNTGSSSIPKLSKEVGVRVRGIGYHNDQVSVIVEVLLEVGREAVGMDCATFSIFQPCGDHSCSHISIICRPVSHWPNGKY